MAAADSQPSDPACPACSKPVRSGSLVLFEHGELFHVSCRSRQLQLRALEQVDRAEAVREHAARRLEDAHRVRAERMQRHGLPKRPAATGVCPLCRGRATVTDWRPGMDWIVVENCPSGAARRSRFAALPTTHPAARDCRQAAGTPCPLA